MYFLSFWSNVFSNAISQRLLVVFAEVPSHNSTEESFHSFLNVRIFGRLPLCAWQRKNEEEVARAMKMGGRRVLPKILRIIYDNTSLIF